MFYRWVDDFTGHKSLIFYDRFDHAQAQSYPKVMSKRREDKTDPSIRPSLLPPTSNVTEKYREPNSMRPRQKYGARAKWQTPNTVIDSTIHLE